jgi:hypothetical protein
MQEGGCQITNINLAWKLLYGEEPESVPDPNKPENAARIKALAKRKRDELDVLFRGPGKPIFELFLKRIRTQNMTLFGLPDLCTCPACELIREMQSTLRMWIGIEQILQSKKEKD